ncbi:type IV pilus modification protein PilV [Thalassotalea psychrophila]|uniref:Type IV pilus modification protein PilV n=1 Tax=Thalassotalea psychrophila TaxID=3065647 RepID=A0ABY9TWW8_9GAMM|nr:type IV pilus modification protein PilV [Colwelliaceae bacterium SQ149]
MTNSTNSAVKNLSFFKCPMPFLPIAKNNGFSLMEVLISMIIISFGMLGLAKLQLNAMVEVQSASYANKAASFAQQMTEMIAANPSALNSYQLSSNQQITVLTDCRSNSCTSSQLAKHDISLWQVNIAKSLPSGQAEVVISENQAKVIVRWDQNRNGSTGLNCPQKSSSDLECATLTRTIR